VSLSEGLADSRRPCARVLSVEGFFAFLERFPREKGFILRVKEASFLRAEAVTVDVPFRSAHLTHQSVYTPSPWCHREPCMGRGREACPTNEGWEGGCIYTLGTREA